MSRIDKLQRYHNSPPAKPTKKLSKAEVKNYEAEAPVLKKKKKKKENVGFWDK